MYARNKTSEWRDKLSKEKLDKALDFAKSKQKALYFKNKKVILEKNNNQTETRYGGEREERVKGC